MVWLKNERRTDKISPRWLGPYRIFSRSDDGRLYQILDISKNAASPVTVHYDKLKPHVGMSPLALSNNTSQPKAPVQENTPATVNSPGPSNEVPAPIVAISAPSPPATPNASPAQSLYNSENSGNAPIEPQNSSTPNSNDTSLNQSSTYSNTSSSSVSFSPVFTSTPELTPSRTGRRRYRPLRLADFLTYQ